MSWDGEAPAEPPHAREVARQEPRPPNFNPRSGRPSSGTGSEFVHDLNEGFDAIGRNFRKHSVTQIKDVSDWSGSIHNGFGSHPERIQIGEQ